MKFSLSQGTASIESRLIREKSQDGDANEDPLRKLSRKVMETHQNAIAETYMMLNMAEFEKVLAMFTQAERVYFFGICDSLLVAQEAMSKFLRVTGKVNCIQDPHMQAVAASMMNEKDLVFIISYSGATKDNILVAKLAKERGARVAAISHFQKSPLTAYCDGVLLCGAKQGPLDGGSMSAKLGQLYLIDLLYQGFYETNMEECMENNQKATAAVAEKLC